MKRIIALLAIVVCLPLSAWATTLELRLVSLEMIRHGEIGGDELYMSITEFPKSTSQKKGRHYQIPKLPIHWTSDVVGKIHDLTLWKGTLEDNDAVTLLVSLIEYDSAPWDLDDLIGSIKVRMRVNDEGKLQSEWTVPNNVEVLPEELIINGEKLLRFNYSGDNGHYVVTYQLLRS